MSNIEKIKAEIERLENMDYPCDTSEQATGFYNALDRISDFINSLPEDDPLNDPKFCEGFDVGRNVQKIFDEPKEMSDIKKQILTLLKQRHHSHKVAIEQEKDPRSKHAIDLIARIREDSRLMELIDSLPEEKPSKDLEEELDNYFKGLWPGTETAEQCNTDLHFTPLAIMRLASHFAEWGAKH